MALAGCDAGYITHAAYEEVRILLRPQAHRRGARPHRSRRAQRAPSSRPSWPCASSPPTNSDLNVGGAYSSVAQVDKGAIVWVVMAAPRTSLTPYTWWFPIVGNVPYRGYFSHAEADAEAAAWKRRATIPTSGPPSPFPAWASSTIRCCRICSSLDRVELAGVIIHELFHRTYFLLSDVMFDESAATWIGNRGAVDFFTRTEGANSADATAARGVYDSDIKFAAFLLQEQARLLRLYRSGLPHDEILKRACPIFAAINRITQNLNQHFQVLSVSISIAKAQQRGPAELSDLFPRSR